jgi:cytochrome o ubiquinol oxidase subunit 3
MANTIQIEHHHEADERAIFGFWIYVLTDCILFSWLFATYAVLYKNVYGGVSIKDITNLHYVLLETMVLLGSSFTYGMAMLWFYKDHLTKLLIWLTITFVLGLLFIGLELNEFISLYFDGNSWQSSAALTAFFSLVGTHGLHVLIGLLFMVVLMFQLSIFGIKPFIKRRLSCLGIFWAFLDIIWIFVFTIVYLMGAI